MGEHLLTAREVADELRVHIETVRRWIRDGALPATNLGRRAGYRVAESDLRRFVEGMRTAPLSAPLSAPAEPAEGEDRP